MNQSVVVKDETFKKVVVSAEAVIGRELTAMEKVMVEYAVDLVRLGLV